MTSTVFNPGQQGLLASSNAWLKVLFQGTASPLSMMAASITDCELANVPGLAGPWVPRDSQSAPTFPNRLPELTKQASAQAIGLQRIDSNLGAMCVVMAPAKMRRVRKNRTNDMKKPVKRRRAQVLLFPEVPCLKTMVSRSTAIAISL